MKNDPIQKIGTRIFLYRTKNKLSRKDKDRAWPILSAPEKKRFLRFKEANSARLYLFGKVKTRDILGELLKTDPAKIVFEQNRFGRPKLRYPRVKNFDFNISHSGNYLVIGVSNKKIGVDIEQIKPIDIGVAKDCFAPEELAYVRNSGKNKLLNFYKIWTLKESYVKMTGRGLLQPLKKIRFTVTGKNIRMDLEQKDETIEAYFNLYRPDSGYLLAICGHNKKILIEKLHDDQ